MFRTFLGRAGTGKSTAILNEIKNKLQAQPLGDPIVLITPMQGTYLYEQALVNDSALKGSMRAEVLHFERLSHRVFQELGGVHETRLSTNAIEMMLYDILQEQKDNLKLYHAQTAYLGFSTKMREQIQDFEKYDVSADMVEAASNDETFDRRTRDKLHDIALIYHQLNQRLSDTFITPEAQMNRFIQLIPNSTWLANADIYIDGFHNFSTQEYQIIEALVKHTQSVTISLTTNGDMDAFSMFRKPSESLQHIEDIATKLDVTLQHSYFNEVYRFQNDALRHLEKHFDALIPEQSSTDATSLRILESPTTRDEVNEIARRILKDVREEGYRYKDIAILYRDPSYPYLLDAILPQFDIPYSLDIKKSMTHHPVMEMLRALIEVIQTTWQFDPLMRLLKTNVLTRQYDDSLHRIDILENYALERGIYGKRWLDPKYFTIDQFEKMGIKHKKLNEDTRALFERVIALKDNVFEKLLTFESRLTEGQHACDYATAFYEVMENFELPHQLMTERDILDEMGKHTEAEEIDQIWNGFSRVLDDVVTVFGTQAMSLSRFLEILDVGLNELEFSMIPQTLDQITVGSMDLAKVDNKKHIYMIGMNDGVMPQALSSKSLISDDEKKHFEAVTHTPLSPTADILQMDEAFVCYHAMTRATHALTLSYSLMDSSGSEKEKSPFLNDMIQLFQQLNVTSIVREHERNTLSLVAHPHQTKVHLFEALKSALEGELISDTWYAVNAVMAAHTSLSQGLDHLKTALTYRNETVTLNQNLTQALYGKTINASVSRFEGYQSCPFKHFASHGLKLNERSKYQLQSFDLGTIFHDVLRYIAEKVEGRFNQLSVKQIQLLTDEALAYYLPEVQYNLLNSTSYYQYLAQRIGAIIQATLQALKHQSEQSQFRPIAFEKAFRKKPRNEEELFAQPLQTRQGIPINIRGQIDRIDTYETHDKSFINIIDYKSSTSSASLDLVKVYYGLQMQMMTYMDIALQNKARLGLASDVKPGGFLYMYVHKFKDDKRTWSNLSTDKLTTAFLKSYQLSGLLNSDPDVIEAYDKRLIGGFSSDVVPLRLKKNGEPYSSSKVADEATLYKLMQHNKRNFVDIASNIMDGHTEVAPLKYKETLPCRFCNYQSVCHVDSLIDSPKYRTVDEKINPLDCLREEEDE
ncbi:helicase-exonuclease AddAB subunit AddB [Staphylococcus agnetis]|uniref:helicase-exonuclease AddAB subunit AddB n=1 Tax=Staphylococcus agnetis TaxID=985762 RepID=UPI0039E89546